MTTNDKIKALQEDDGVLKVATELQLNCEILQVVLPAGIGFLLKSFFLDPCFLQGVCLLKFTAGGPCLFAF